jgi:hypothetical protein
MYLFKRGSRYHLSFTVDEGKEVRVSTGCRTKVEATAFLLKFKADRHQQKLRRDQKTFSDFIKEFERHSQCQHSPKTTSSYRTAMEEFQRAMGDRQLKEYGIRDVEDFILKKRGDLSLHSVRSYHTHLSAAFEVARKWGYIEDNPFRKVKRVKPPQSTPVFVTKDHCSDDRNEAWRTHGNTMGRCGSCHTDHSRQKSGRFHDQEPEEPGYSDQQCFANCLGTKARVEYRSCIRIEGEKICRRDCFKRIQASRQGRRIGCEGPFPFFEALVCIVACAGWSLAL